MPVDDDTNYVVLAQKVIDKYGREFTPRDMSKAWLAYQAKDAYCTAERVAAMIAVAAYADDVEEIIRGGLAEIPYTSRLYESLISVVDGYKTGVSKNDCFAMIHSRWDEHKSHDWCHTISNAMIVAASLLYGAGDFSKSICMAVETGFDTDCNGATVGSILGMANGENNIPAYWKEPIHDTVHTSIFGVGTVKISDCVEKTFKHLI